MLIKDLKPGHIYKRTTKFRNGILVGLGYKGNNFFTFQVINILQKQDTVIIVALAENTIVKGEWTDNLEGFEHLCCQA